VRPRLLQRFRPFRRRDREVAGPHKRQKEQCDLQRGVSQDSLCNFADKYAGLNHSAQSRASRSPTVARSEHGNAVKYDIGCFRLNEVRTVAAERPPISCNPSSNVAPAALSFGVRRRLMFMSKVP
jgi:hypothetical protein